MASLLGSLTSAAGALASKLPGDLAGAVGLGGPHRVEVGVHEFSSLKQVQLVGAQDPYVEVFVGSGGSQRSVGRTKVLTDAGSAGRFDETFTVSCNVDTDTLTLVFMDRGMAALDGTARMAITAGLKAAKPFMEDKEIGRCEVRLASLRGGGGGGGDTGTGVGVTAVGGDMDTRLPISGTHGSFVSAGRATERRSESRCGCCRRSHCDRCVASPVTAQWRGVAPLAPWLAGACASATAVGLNGGGRGFHAHTMSRTDGRAVVGRSAAHLMMHGCDEARARGP